MIQKESLQFHNLIFIIDLHSTNWNRSNIPWATKKKVRFWLDIRKKSFTIGWWGIGTGCPERWWVPIPGDTQGQAGGALSTWWSCRCPCSVQGCWTRWPLGVPSNSNGSVILWVWAVCAVHDFWVCGCCSHCGRETLESEMLFALSQKLQMAYKYNAGYHLDLKCTVKVKSTQEGKIWLNSFHFFFTPREVAKSNTVTHCAHWATGVKDVWG